MTLWPAAAGCRVTVMTLFAHQPGASTFSESTDQPGLSKLHKVVPAGLRPPNRTTRTYVGPADIVRDSWARSNMTRDQWQTWAGGRTSSSRTPRQREAEAELGLG